MNITRVGKRVMPAVFVLSAMTATANNINNTTNKTIQPNKNQIEIKETSKKKSNNGIGNILLWGALGGAIGSGATLGMINKLRKRKSVDNYYDKKFEKEAEEIAQYMGTLINRAIGNRPYFVDIEEFSNATSKFTKHYPSRKEYLYAATKVLADARLDDTEADILFQYFSLRAICTDEEWKSENIFPFLDNCSTYEDTIREFYMRTIQEEEKDNNETNVENGKPAQNDKKKTDDNISDINKSEIHHNLKFSDVGGQEKAKEILKHNILYPIKYPKAFENDNMNHGFVLYGAPGTGKTLIAETLANETKAYFIKLNGNELSSKWVGSTEENWRKVFNNAKKHQPSIIFVDEFDGVASTRGSGDIHGDKVVNHILALLSNVEKNNDKVYFIATTNRLDKIDPAVLRPGRLSTHIELTAPQNEEEIEQIMDIHLKKYPVDKDFNKKSYCKELLDLKCTGADIAFIVNKSFVYAREHNGIFEKMDNNTFKDTDMDSVMIKNMDFDSAIAELEEERGNKKTPIGFKQICK